VPNDSAGASRADRGAANVMKARMSGGTKDSAAVVTAAMRRRRAARRSGVGEVSGLAGGEPSLLE
jgi:hypothetical protein